MNHLRFSLLTLLAGVAVMAVACAALRYASELWGSAILTLTLGVLLAAILGTVLRHGPARAFWFGFAVFGWAYLALSLGWFSTNCSQHLLTTKLLAYVHGATTGSDRTVKAWYVSTGQQLATSQAHSDVVNSVAFSPDGKLLVSGTADKTIRIWNLPSAQLPTWEHFHRVGHSLAALLVALLGGLLARYVFGRGNAPPARAGAFEREAASV